jgi:hypothetical protein
MRRIIYLLLIALFLLPISVHSYVVIFYRENPRIYEVSHRSIILYDRENQKVGLIPQISFRGRPEDFCVVVPTPEAPRLNTVTGDVFYEADRLTDSIRRERGSGCISGNVLIDDDDDYAVSETGVDVIDEQSVGLFDTVTLSATDPDALINWLQENGYNYTAQDKEIIDYYIARGWVFTAMKLGASVQGEEYYYSYRYNINPVLFRYSASSLVYPIPLISINAADRTDILMYVLSDTRMTFPGARTEYANRIDDDELENIVERYPAFGGLIGQHRYLTKLRRTFSILEMDEDIDIVPAEENTEFRKVIYYGMSPAMDFIPLGIVAALFLALRTLRERRKKVLERGSSSRI